MFDQMTLDSIVYDIKNRTGVTDVELIKSWVICDSVQKNIDWWFQDHRNALNTDVAEFVVNIVSDAIQRDLLMKKEQEAVNKYIDIYQQESDQYKQQLANLYNDLKNRPVDELFSFCDKKDILKMAMMYKTSIIEELLIKKFGDELKEIMIDKLMKKALIDEKFSDVLNMKKKRIEDL